MLPLAVIAVGVPKARSVEVHKLPVFDVAVADPRVTAPIGKIMVDAVVAVRMATAVVQVTKSVVVVYAFVRTQVAVVVETPVNESALVPSTAEK